MENISPQHQQELEVSVSEFKVVRFTTFYTITLTNGRNGDTHSLDKRFKQFYDLNQLLIAKNYIELPRLPQRTMMPVRNQADLERRKQELDVYMKSLVQRCDIRNSKDVIKFLELDQFCLELLIQKPKVIETMECSEPYFYVTHCIYNSKNKIFAICLNDKFKKNAKLEVYSIKQTKEIRDSQFNRIINMSIPEFFTPLTLPFPLSLCNSCQDQMHLENNKNNQNNQEIDHQDNSEKLLEYLFNNQIKALTFSEELDLLSIGFKDGKIQSFYLNIEEEGNEGSDNEYNDRNSNDEMFSGNIQSVVSRKKSKKKDVDGTILMKKAFEQARDTESNNKQSLKKQANRISNEDFIQNCYEEDTYRHYLEFSRHSSISAHKEKITDMKLDLHKNQIFSVGADKKLNVIDLQKKAIISTLKTSNAKFRCIHIDSEIRRLYASSYEGQLFIFKIGSAVPIVLHSFTFGEEFGYIKRLQYDEQKRILLCLAKSNTQLCIKIAHKDERNSKIIYNMDNKYETECISSIQWVDPLNSYLTGSNTGKARFCDYQQDQNCLFFLPTDFTQKISCMHFSKEQNLLFVGSKDGKFRIWKTPTSWRYPQQIAY